MAELADILASGVLTAVNAQELEKDGIPLALIIAANYADGIRLPEIPSVNAENNSIFFNTDNDRVCWKSRTGTVLRFQLAL